MRWTAIACLVLAVLTFVLLAVLHGEPYWSGFVFDAFLVLSALLTLLVAVRQTPRDGAALGTGIAAGVGALGLLGAEIYLSDPARAVSDIGISGLWLLCLLLTLICLPIALTRVR